MSDAYVFVRGRVAAKLAEWKQGTVTLIRTTHAAPDPSTTWIPGIATTELYTLDAVVKGVSDQYVNGLSILASDLMVKMSPKVAGADFEPYKDDLISIDGGVPKAIKQINKIIGAGVAAAYLLFVES